MYKDETIAATTPSQESTEHDEEHEHRIEDKLNMHDSSFRRHYQLNYADEPLEYESFFAPAYRFGYQLSAANSDSEWESVKELAHSEWVANHQVSWETVADAVEYGWQEERNPEENRVDHRHGISGVK